MTTKENNNDICLSIPCHSRAIDSSTLSPSGPIQGSNKQRNHYFLDTRVKHEYNNLAPSSCHSQTKMPSSCHSRAMTRESRSEDIKFMNNDIMLTGCSGRRPSMTRTISQSGRSMVEMLGVLAVIGVLSIAGIMGYSYGMDKYRANETINDVNLRYIDVLAQYENTGDATLDAWKGEKTFYPITLEEGTIGIQVDEVPERVCNIIFSDMINMADIKINGTTYIEKSDNVCTNNNNTMIFYFDKNASNKITNDEDCTSGSILKSCITENGLKGFCIASSCVPDGTIQTCGGQTCVGDEGCTACVNDTCITLRDYTCTKNQVEGICLYDGTCGQVQENCEQLCLEQLFGISSKEEMIDDILYQAGTAITLDSFIKSAQCHNNECILPEVQGCLDKNGKAGLLWGSDYTEARYYDALAYGCWTICKTDADCNGCSTCTDAYNQVSFCTPNDLSTTCSIDGKDGICFAGNCIELPPENTCGGEVCQGDAGCSICIDNKCSYTPDYIAVCEKNGKKGLCAQGKCIEGCKEHDSCGSNKFCGSPNSSDIDKYPKGFGICKDLKYTEFPFNGQTYYISQEQFSWWDAPMFCEALKKELLPVNKAVENNVWENFVATSLGSALLNSYSSLWVNDCYLYDGYCGRGELDYPPESIANVVCQ